MIKRSKGKMTVEGNRDQAMPTAPPLRARRRFARASHANGGGVIEELIPAPHAFDVFRALSGLSQVIYLDSALSHARLSRYSFVAVDPFLTLGARRGRVWTSGLEESQRIADPFSVLSHWLAQFSAETYPELPPFQGGAAGLFGY